MKRRLLTLVLTGTLSVFLLSGCSSVKSTLQSLNQKGAQPNIDDALDIVSETESTELEDTAETYIEFPDYSYYHSFGYDSDTGAEIDYYVVMKPDGNITVCYSQEGMIGSIQDVTNSGSSYMIGGFIITADGEIRLHGETLPTNDVPLVKGIPFGFEETILFPEDTSFGGNASDLDTDFSVDSKEHNMPMQSNDKLDRDVEGYYYERYEFIGGDISCAVYHNDIVEGIIRYASGYAYIVVYNDEFAGEVDNIADMTNLKVSEDYTSVSATEDVWLSRVDTIAGLPDGYVPHYAYLYDGDVLNYSKDDRTGLDSLLNGHVEDSVAEETYSVENFN